MRLPAHFDDADPGCRLERTGTRTLPVAWTDCEHDVARNGWRRPRLSSIFPALTRSGNRRDRPRLRPVGDAVARAGRGEGSANGRWARHAAPPGGTWFRRKWFGVRPAKSPPDLRRAHRRPIYGADVMLVIGLTGSMGNGQSPRRRTRFKKTRHRGVRCGRRSAPAL